MTIGYQYIYVSHEEIFFSAGKLLSSDLFTMSLGIGFFIATIFCIFIVLPALIIFLREYKKKREKRNKKKLLTQILLQKELEDEVEREIKIDDKKDAL